MTTQLEQAAKNALEALNRSDYLGWQVNIPIIKALRAALEQPAQNEPVEFEDVYLTIIQWDIAGKRSRRELARRIVALYTRSQPVSNPDDLPTVKQSLTVEQPAQDEPIGHVTVRRLSQRFENHVDQYHFYPAGQSPYLDNVDELHAVYTHPPAREPLTDEEIGKIILDQQITLVNYVCADKQTEFARAIEAAHGIGEKK